VHGPVGLAKRRWLPWTIERSTYDGQKSSKTGEIWRDTNWKSLIHSSRHMASSPPVKGL
jgi:hypothetical protein